MSISFNRRTKVLLALVVSMTFGSWVLIVLGPERPIGAISLFASTRDQWKWKRIVIHESGSATDDLASLDKRFEKDGGCAYHLLVFDNGTVKETQRAIEGRAAPDWAGDGALTTIHIAVIGRFDQRPASDKQMKSLGSLVDHLIKSFHIPADKVLLHRQVDPVEGKDCPGPAFQFRRS